MSHLAITIYGVCAVTFMMVMYALEGRDRRFIAAFAAGCLLSSVYGFLAGAWPLALSRWSGLELPSGVFSPRRTELPSLMTRPKARGQPEHWCAQFWIVNAA